jgi:hypothetical protein
MLARPTLTRPVQDATGPPKTQARPTEERFLLRVDGQIKRSFSSKEDAAAVGAVVKKAYPVVVVTVIDTEEHRDHQCLGNFHSPTSPALTSTPLPARMSLQTHMNSWWPRALSSRPILSYADSGEMHSDAVCRACLAPQWLHSYSRFVRVPPSESLVSTRTSHIW